MCGIANSHGALLKEITISVLIIFEPGMLCLIQCDLMEAKSSEVEAQFGT